MADRTLDDTIRFIALRITALSETMAERHDWSYAGRAIGELVEALARMPFTAQEVRYLHEVLQPVVAKHGQPNRSGEAENHWMEPVLRLLERVPSPGPSSTGTLIPR